MVQRLLEIVVMRLTHAAMVLLASLAGPASAGSDHAHRASTAATPKLSCPEAVRAQVVLPDGLDGIDGVRVYVTDARPGARCPRGRAC